MINWRTICKTNLMVKYGWVSTWKEPRMVRDKLWRWHIIL